MITDKDYALMDGESCDTCASQEGRHYCLLLTQQIKNMDLHICDEWSEKEEKP